VICINHNILQNIRVRNIIRKQLISPRGELVYYLRRLYDLFQLNSIINILAQHLSHRDCELLSYCKNLQMTMELDILQKSQVHTTCLLMSNVLFPSEVTARYHKLKVVLYQLQRLGWKQRLLMRPGEVPSSSKFKQHTLSLYTTHGCLITSQTHKLQIHFKVL
jgi:hypothetical protein